MANDPNGFSDDELRELGAALADADDATDETPLTTREIEDFVRASELDPDLRPVARLRVASLPLTLFDKRTVKRNVRTGRLSSGDYQVHLEELPDVESNIRSRAEGGDVDGWDERGASPAPAVEVDAVLDGEIEHGPESSESSGLV